MAIVMAIVVLAARVLAAVFVAIAAAARAAAPGRFVKVLAVVAILSHGNHEVWQHEDYELHFCL